MNPRHFPVEGAYTSATLKAVGPARKKSAFMAFFKNLGKSFIERDLSKAINAAKGVNLGKRVVASNAAFSIAMHALEDPKIMQQLEALHKQKNIWVKVNSKGELELESSDRKVAYAEAGPKVALGLADHVSVGEIMNLVKMHKGANFRTSTSIALQAVEDKAIKSGISAIKGSGYTHIFVNPKGEVFMTKLRPGGKPGEFITPVPTNLELTPAQNVRLPISEIEKLIAEHEKKSRKNPDHVHLEKRKWGFR